MDSLRGHFPEDHGSGESHDFDLSDDESDREVPPVAIGQDERRMQVRAYNFWVAMLADRNFPSIEDLDPERLPDFGPYSVLLDFSSGMEDPAIRFLGDRLGAECGAGSTISQLSDVPARSLLSRITDHYMQILANQAPIGFEAEFVNQRGTTILYRGILLPFSSDDDTIDFIYGVINWKELADQKTTDELLLEIDQALEPRTEARREDGPLTEWADGPAELPVQSIEPDDFSQPDTLIPEPSFGQATAVSDTDCGTLADTLASARELAEAARCSEERSRRALYAAIGRAYDFSLSAARESEQLAALLEDAGIAVQERAPMTPVVKLVFGAGYDKTRLAEYACALDHAHRVGMARGTLEDHLSSLPGGLKAFVAEERLVRRGDNPPQALITAPRPGIARKLRKIEPRTFAEVASEGEEFTLLVARRLPDGEVVFLGEISDNVPLLEKAARHLIG
ncbi:PAS domain-containing protein [Novosphingobium marinum]|uniref:PAS domain-containing protein n=1 Tax=Novosphingobium marinum TaxID=1514948 RepID=A0A7Y9XYF6_9SPHN|nr:hypothetical protein [Novosphingobium marinum]NYH95573.1 hypothetical protein [Novosphingobium marinum]